MIIVALDWGSGSSFSMSIGAWRNLLWWKSKIIKAKAEFKIYSVQKMIKMQQSSTNI